MAFSPSSSFFDIEPIDGGWTWWRRAMDACFLCGKRLAGDCDIFMYRGDMPFCSEECRYRQMVRDDARKKKKTTHPRAERPARRDEQQRRGHEITPAAAEPAHVPLAANVPVAI
ncbi:hypothetical protein U9M48_022370 [Paspalum notatum var. saurae]|uniref:FLZ-type domain-containing protein n=1 Tax=Paspalum notatum var. saurae TaxID=547442 RepID=A0AAQ3WUP5_PASNO